MKLITFTLLGLALITPYSIFAANPPANAEAARRVAEQLAGVYGQKLDSVVYIPALALVAKLRLSELTGDPKYAAIHQYKSSFGGKLVRMTVGSRSTIAAKAARRLALVSP